MNLIHKINTSKKVFYFILITVFSIVLLFNSLTPYSVDDYDYHYSFDTGELISNIFEIFPSMRAHYQSANGRVVAHFFVQIFEMLPKTLFNFVNSLAFIALLFLIYKISIQNRVNNFFFLSVFAATWIFVPAFGQVFLWLDGSCNYLWGAVISLLYSYLFFFGLIYDITAIHKNSFRKILFILFGFFVGAYLENTAVATVFICFLTLSYKIFNKHEKVPFFYFLSTIMLVAGILFMLASPAEQEKGGMSIDRIYLASERIVEVFYSLFPLILAYSFSLILILCNNAPKRIITDSRILLSLLFFSGGICANFVMFFSRSYPDRCALYVSVLFIVSVFILFSELINTTHLPAVLCVMTALVFSAVYSGFWGAKDIVRTYSLMTANIETIIGEASLSPDSIITVPIIHPKTKYSSIDGLIYFSTEGPDHWPNIYAAKYYGVAGIVGTEDPNYEAQVMHEKLFGY